MGIGSKNSQSIEEPGFAPAITWVVRLVKNNLASTVSGEMSFGAKDGRSK